VNRVIAGSYGPWDRSERRPPAGLLAPAFDGEGSPNVQHFGALTIASSGPDPPAARPLCLLDGHIWNLSPLARQVGISAGQAPERILGTAYARWGSDLVERLRGEFALLIWDPIAERGLLARDQLGQRPMHINPQGERLIFASEIRDLLPLLSQRPGPDDLAVAHWLDDGIVPENRTLYEGVHRLGAGHLIELADGGWSARRYWSLTEKSELRLSRQDAAERLRSEIARSIRDRISGEIDSGEGRVGVLMSGGLDSSSVAATACNVAVPEKVKAYSVTFPEHPQADESSLIDMLTARLGIDAARVSVTAPKPLAAALDYLDAWKVPPLAPNYFFWQALLDRAAADGVSVILGGDGGDELFGAARYLPADRLRQGRPLAAVTAAGGRPWYGSPPPRIEVMRRMRHAGLRGAAPYGLHRAVRCLRGPRASPPPWLRDEYGDLVAETTANWSWKRLGGERWRAFIFHLITSVAERQSARDHFRRSASSAGLSHRHPFYDVDLIELVLRLPPELALDPRLSRPLLREAMRGLVPDEIRLRPQKSHFGAVVADGQLAELSAARRLLDAADAEVRAYTHPKAVHELLSRVPSAAEASAPGGWAATIWRLVTMECWLRAQRDHPRSPSFASNAEAAPRIAYNG
jgi:asparagine synthase (glutamine-hydrolysing)